MKRVFWMHTDCLRQGDEQDAIFIFDPQQIEESGWGIKRLMFVYECLLQLPAVRIMKGDTVEILVAEGVTVVTESTPDPWICGRITSLKARGVSVDVMPAPPFAGVQAEGDLRRFSRYWKKAETRLLQR